LKWFFNRKGASRGKRAGNTKKRIRKKGPPLGGLENEKRKQVEKKKQGTLVELRQKNEERR